MWYLKSGTYDIKEGYFYAALYLYLTLAKPENEDLNFGFNVPVLLISISGWFYECRKYFPDWMS